MPVKDGRVEIVQALAALTNDVRIDLTTNPIALRPANLFALRFNDVGVDDGRMTDFKKTLKTLLAKDGIDSVIDRIPENSMLVIEDVAEVVDLALALSAAGEKLKGK